MNSEMEPQEKECISDEENDLNLTNVRPKKGRQIIDSDSDDEVARSTLKQPNATLATDIESKSSADKCEETNDELMLSTESRPVTEAEVFDNAEIDKHKEISANNTESTISANLNAENNDETSKSDELKSNGVEVKKKPKRIAIVDSDSDEEEVCITPHNKSFNEDLELPHSPHVINNTPIFVVNEKGKLVPENQPENDAILKSRLASLCDAESSEDENCNKSTADVLPGSLPPKKRAQVKRSKPQPSVDDPKKMTAKDAQQQRQEIRSETQRMLRESRVSLPYHKPKARSIREFLQNRPRLSLSLLNTNNTPPSIAMKMSTQQLELVTQKLQERKKEVEKFYKSESESDEEPVRDDRQENGPEIPSQVIGADEVSPPTISQLPNDSQLVEAKSDEITECSQSESNPETIEHSLPETNQNQPSETDENPQIIPGNNKEINEEQLHAINLQVTSEPSETESAKVATEASSVDPETELQVNEAESNELDLPDENRTDAIAAPESKSVDESQPQNVEADACDDSDEYEFNLDDLHEQSDDAPELSEKTSAENRKDSVEYDFNLDDLDDDDFPTEPQLNAEQDITAAAQKNVEEQHLERLLKKYQDVSETKTVQPKKLNRADLLKQIGSIKPRLSGAPDQEIDLDDGVIKPTAITQLMQRFMQHAATKNTVKDKVELDIINFTQGELRKETVAMAVDPEDEPIAVSEKPGLRFRKLKDELQSQMAQRRSELWQQKHQALNEGGIKKTSGEEDEERSECGADDDFLDDEAEFTEIECTDDEDDYENIERPEKPQVKSAFIDDEAEESDEDVDEMQCDSQNNVNEEESEEPTEKTDDTTVDVDIKKPKRRILKGFTEDSDDDGEADDEDDDASRTVLNLTGKKDDQGNTAATWEDDYVLPPNRVRVDKTPHKEMTQSKSEFGFLTPVQYLTGIQNLGSGSKFLRDDSPASLFSLPPDPSPLKETIGPSDLQKKLFSDSCDTLDSETHMDDIAQLCSDKFPSPTIGDGIGETTTTQDLINICSGSFPEMSRSVSNSKTPLEGVLEEVPKARIENENFQNAFVKPMTQINLDINVNNEIKNLDDDDGLISQLLNEEEMELFKKKFESPVANVSRLTQNDELEMEVQGGGRLVSDSSDDEDDDGKNPKKIGKRLQRKLAFSDDDNDSESEEQNKDEQIDLHDDCSDGDTNLNKIDYDSEENEIELDDDQDEEAPARQKLKPSDFLEKEAELSESDWDSADEDEKGLDELELEQGDAEVFDENQMRTDLEKIHMRRVLDQDNREIKILQEMLLEDGELHGTGRQRQFRWRNIDDAQNEGETRSKDIDAYLDEEETEEQWRRARHQREMFLKAKQEKLVEDDEFVSIETESQVLKMGQEAVRKSVTTTVTTLIEKTKTPSSVVQKPLMLLSTRGSFLARTDRFLTRLAEFTKVTDNPVVGAPKNGKKIVFQTISNSTNDSSSTKHNVAASSKRKADDGNGTPAIIKKLRLSSSMTPEAKNKNSKKQLFK